MKKSKITLPDNVDPKPFYNHFFKKFDGKMSQYLYMSSANLLAIDYAGRLNSEPDLQEYMVECSDRVQGFLENKPLLKDSFDFVMQIFTIAITKEKKLDEGNDRVQNQEFLQEQNQDLFFKTFIDNNFADLNESEIENIRSLLKSIIGEDNGRDAVEMVFSNPKLFYSMIVSAQRSKKTQKEVLESLQIQLMQLASKLGHNKIHVKPKVLEGNIKARQGSIRTQIQKGQKTLHDKEKKIVEKNLNRSEKLDSLSKPKLSEKFAKMIASTVSKGVSSGPGRGRM